MRDSSMRLMLFAVIFFLGGLLSAITASVVRLSPANENPPPVSSTATVSIAPTLGSELVTAMPTVPGMVATAVPSGVATAILTVAPASETASPTEFVPVPTETPVPPTATPLPPTPQPPTATPVPPAPTATTVPPPESQVLPYTGRPKPESPAASLVYYKVRYGDNLTAIAYRYGTTVQAIRRANALSSTVIYAGQLLLIPTR